MKISGSATVHSSPESVWAALADRDLLVRVVPGLDRLDAGSDGRRQFAVTIAIAAVSGSYAGEASVVDRAEPGLLVLHVSATGARGTVIADLTIRLAPLGDGGTQLSYEAEAEVEGAIAGIGQRMVVSIARRLAANTISAIDAALATGAVAEDRLGSAPVGPATAQTGAAGDTAGPPPGRDVDAAAIERVRHGIRPRGEAVPALDQSGPLVRAGLVAGVAAGLAGILIGALLGRRGRAGAPGGRAAARGRR
jgi:carbon monoxide dehydrogenase subunit G